MSTNFERRAARRKRQTRLGFDPVDEPSSSGTAKTMSPARVIVQKAGGTGTATGRGRGRGKQQMMISSEEDYGSGSGSGSGSASKKIPSIFRKEDVGLPTPRKSNQILPLYAEDVDFDDEDDSSAGSPPEDGTPSKKVLSSMAKKAKGAKGAKKRQKSITISGSEDELFLPPPPKQYQRVKGIFGSGTSAKSTPIPKPKTRPVVEIPSHGKNVITLDDSDSDLEITDMPKNLQKRQTKLVATFEGSDSDSEPIASLPLKRRRAVVESDSEDSDIKSSPLKRRKPAPLDEDEDEDEDDSEDTLPSPSKVLAKGKQNTFKNIGKQNRRESARGKRKPDPVPSTPSRFTRQQKAPKKHRTEKEKATALMKRRRAGEKIDQLTDSGSDSEEEGGGIYDTDDELEALKEFDDEEDSPEESRVTKNVPKKKNSQEAAKKDDYDAEFVDDDSDDMLGVPEMSQIPLQFTHAAHKQLKEHFKDVVEWMVHKKVNPAFNKDDPMYRQAFAKMSDEVSGLATSKFISTQWTAEFTRALKARPELHERGLADGEGLNEEGIPKCDVCNHRKHYPKYGISLKGKAYSMDTLEEFDDDSDSSDSDASNTSRDENGFELPPQDKEWCSGAVCRLNAVNAHTLTHWKYNLNLAVLDKLKSYGELKPSKLAAREEMRPKERRNDANGIVDRWESDQTIRGLYNDFRSMVAKAKAASTTGGRNYGERE